MAWVSLARTIAFFCPQFSLFLIFSLLLRIIPDILGIGVCKNQPKDVTYLWFASMWKNFSHVCINVSKEELHVFGMANYILVSFSLLYFPLLSFLSLKYGSYEINLVMIIMCFLFPHESVNHMFCIKASLKTFSQIMVWKFNFQHKFKHMYGWLKDISHLL